MSTQTYIAEYIFPGHPDKLSDAIADALVIEAIQRESRALIGVEVAVHRDHVYLTGRIACKDSDKINLEKVVRNTYQSAGYNKDWYPSPEQTKVISNLCLDQLQDGEPEFRELSDDQAICIGYANQYEQTNHLPVEQWLVNKLAFKLYQLRIEDPTLGLGPDGKVIIAVTETLHGISRAWSLDQLSCSLQQKASRDEIALHRAIRNSLQDELTRLSAQFPQLSDRLPDHIVINGAGAFEVGGPEGDNGLSGKKLVVDAYGPRIQIGGGAWSGKDFFKPDRAGGLHARRIAKTLVQLGLAEEATVTIGWFPGDQSARVIRITDQDHKTLDSNRIEKHFDLSLLKSGTTFPVKNLIEVARWGHFTNKEFPWEKTLNQGL